MYADFAEARGQVDWSAPLFKLTYRLDERMREPDTLIAQLLNTSVMDDDNNGFRAEPGNSGPCLPVTQLRVKTENIGDHIQIIAAEDMLRRAGLHPSRFVDRDDEIAEQPPEGGPTAILINGWFKTNPAQWPPHPDYVPVYLGFHIRLFQAPSLTSEDALAHYREHGPIGCRDRYTLSLLRSHDVEAFLSHCLTLCFPRRLPDPSTQTEVFVVSRDRTILEHLPKELGPYQFVSHYSGSGNFTTNMAVARDFLKTYRARAKLIVTSMLHCAIPAIAMGIPVVVIYPPNSEPGCLSDKQRFSSLSDIVRAFELNETGLIDWRGYCPDVSDIKLRLVDSFFDAVSKWGELSTPRIEGFAPAAALPVPEPDDSCCSDDLERLQRPSAAQVADRQKWGRKSSYRPEWADRGRLAAQFIEDGETVLELGAGTGTLRALLLDRCNYVGTDLQPVDEEMLTLDLEVDPLPTGRWDAAVMLGVLEYLHRPRDAMSRVFASTSKVVMSYCFAREGDFTAVRHSRGWVSNLSEEQLLEMSRNSGFRLTAAVPFNCAEDFDQKVLVFCRGDTGTAPLEGVR